MGWTLHYRNSLLFVGIGIVVKKNVRRKKWLVVGVGELGWGEVWIAGDSDGT